VVDTDFANNLVATVTDQFGNPIEGSTVTFTATGTTANGIFTNDTVKTDVDGKATIALKANTKEGAFSAIGKVTGVNQSADFALTNNADKPSQIIPTNANQTAIVSQPFNTALQVQVLDQYGNPIANNAITLTLPTNGASGLFTGGGNTIVLTTDANGLVTTPLTANNTPGTYSGTIAVTGIDQTSQFTFTNEAAPITPITPINPINPINPNQPLVPIDRTRNLENRNPEKPIVVPSNGKAILCVERSNGSASDNDAYQGVATCGSSSAQSNSDVGNTSRNGNRQARTDDQRSLIQPLAQPIVEVR
jgi:adhesin/invasin